MNSFNSNRDVEIQLALDHAANAVVAWNMMLNEPKTPDINGVMSKLSLAISWVQRVNDGKLTIQNPAEFLELLKKPIRDWLPSDQDERLMDMFGVTAFAQDWVAEHGCESESTLIQEQMLQVMSKLRSRKNGAQLYSEFREKLISSPVMSLGTAQQLLLPTGLNFSQVFEDIPNNYQHKNLTDYFPCPVCRWPMKRYENMLRCLGDRCYSLGSQFNFTEDKLHPLGALPAPASKPAFGMFRLKQGFWRYTLLPGLVELDLKQRLEKLNGVKVTLWPNLDQYDLLVQVGEIQIKIDVKDWTNALALARAINNNSNTEKLIYVVPDDRRQQVKILQERCANLIHLQFMSVTGLLKTVKQMIADREAPF